MQRYCRVAIDSPVGALDRPFDYEIPERMLERVAVGSVVRVVLHGRNMRAFVVELLDAPDVAKPRPLSSLVSPDPLFDTETIALARWTARRYVAPLGVVLHDQVPGRFSAPAVPTVERADRDVLRPGWIGADVDAVVDRREEASVVLPSIGDEPELIAYLASRAGRCLVICPRVDIAEEISSIVGGAILHGTDKPSERAASWAAARDGKVDVVVGGRSALFVPMRDVRLVVVASAHDRSLKSERAPRLHALVVARQRARSAGAAFIASSPAPPVDIAAMPRIETRRGLVKPEVARPRKGPVTPRLLEVVRSALERGADALVFAGRRGDALRLRCDDCGWSPECPSCGTGMALERRDRTKLLVCRMCGTTADVPDECASCRGHVGERGWGHERIARELERAKLGAPVVRIVAGDERIDRPRPAVVVGTLAAAHAVRDAEAVCVADLDQLLGRPDFRAAEVALQTLYELAASLAPGGRYLVQTRESEHTVVQAFTRGSFRYFIDRELPERKDAGYPPYGVVIRVDVGSGDLDALARAVDGTGARVVGAVPRKNRTIALIRGPELEPLLDPLRDFSRAHTRTKIDVDPVDIA